jgi:hypothetical protein
MEATKELGSASLLTHLLLPPKEYNWKKKKKKSSAQFLKVYPRSKTKDH